MQQRALTELCHISCVCAYDRTKCQLNPQVSLVIYFSMPNMSLKQRTACPPKHIAMYPIHRYLDQDKAVQCQQQDGGS